MLHEGFKLKKEEIDSHVPKIIDLVFTKTSQNARFLLSENERFGLVFVKTGSINSGNGHYVRNLSVTPIQGTLFLCCRLKL